MTAWDLDPSRSELLLWTEKEGLLSRVAHDLCLAASDYTARLEEREGALEVVVRVQVASLRVRGHVRGGEVTPLSAKDHAEIERNLCSTDVLDAGRFPALEWRGQGALGAGGVVRCAGELSLRGRTAPLACEGRLLREEGLVRVEGQVSFAQTRFGIRPFRAMMGALKVKDEVRVTWRLTLAPAEGT
ncbi:MAG: YceI family protein [Planctomycetota bacterium]